MCQCLFPVPPPVQLEPGRVILRDSSDGPVEGLSHDGGAHSLLNQLNVRVLIHRIPLRGRGLHTPGVPGVCVTEVLMAVVTVVNDGYFEVVLIAKKNFGNNRQIFSLHLK